jgi:hypothetical protein
MNTMWFQRWLGRLALAQWLGWHCLVPAQTPPPIQWQAGFGGTHEDRLASLQLTSDGGCLLGGWSSSGVSGNKISGSFGGQDYWLLKLDVGGAKQWETNYGGTTNDLLKVVLPTSDDGWLLGGYSESTAGGNKTSGNFGGRDYWVVKLDAAGAKQWETNYGGTLDDQLPCLLATSDGGYLLGGHSMSDASGNKTSGRYGTSSYSDLWLVKTDAQGRKQWETNYGGTGSEILYWIESTGDGGYLLAALSTSGATGNKTTGNLGGTDAWLLKLNAAGVKQWETNYGGTTWDEPRCVRRTSDGQFLLAGQSASGISGNKTCGTFGDWDYWVMKLDAQGSRLWETNFGGTRGDQLTSMQLAGDGGCWLGGWSESGITGNKTSTNYGLSDWWIVRLDANGGKLWETNFGGTQSDVFSAMQFTPDGGCLLGGSSSSTNGGNRTPVAFSPLLMDYWVVKLAGPPPVVFLPGSLHRTTNGAFGFQLGGGTSGLVQRVEVSTNLVSWDHFALITNTGAPETLLDPGATNSNCRYYRAR